MIIQDSKVVFVGKVVFQDNSGSLGGAIYIQGDSVIMFSATCNVEFRDNFASDLGGAIYSRVINHCTFDVQNTPHIYLKGNSASIGDQHIYIENTDNCGSSGRDFMNKFKFNPLKPTAVLFPLQHVKLDFEPISRMVMLGEHFHLIPLELTDSNNGSSIGIGYLDLTSNSDYSLKGPTAVNLDESTQKITFFIYGPLVNETLRLAISVSFLEQGSYKMSKVNINFNLVPCRIGYTYDYVTNSCSCITKTKPSDALMCSSSGYGICIKQHYWYDYDSKEALPCPASHCTFNECPQTSKDCFNFSQYCSIQASSDVCQTGRSGFLCSECAANHAFTFSALKCIPIKENCHPGHTTLLCVILLAYWGLLGVAFLLLVSVKLSVGLGFMYGITYFFSVAMIYLQSSVVFQGSWLQIIASISEAVVLLDPSCIGYIEFCFFKDFKNPLYHEAFRFSTPLVFLVLTGIFVVLSRYRASKCLSFSNSSPIHAICLIILLSYTSISYTSLKLLVPIKLDGSFRVQVAPSLSSFHKEHLPFAIIAIFAELFFSLPICFLFLFAPLIFKNINLVKLHLKPLVDDFQACYKPEYRWFAGFYFLARQIVYCLSMTSKTQYSQYNVLLTSVNVMILITHATIQPYKKKWMNFLDIILLSDLVILSITSSEASHLNNFDTLSSTFILHCLILVPTLYLIGVYITISYIKVVPTKLKNFVTNQVSLCGGRIRQCTKQFRQQGLSGDSSNVSHSRRNNHPLHSNSGCEVNPREPLLEDESENREQISPSYGSFL